jgi:hypothetical protein
MSHEGVLRFAVGTPSRLRSSVWRLWVYRSEAYLAGRYMGSWLKLSLHSSGIWRLAWAEELEREEAGDRVLKRWQRPPDYSEGWAKGPSIAVPAPLFPDLLDSADGQNLRDVIWVPEPNPDTSVFLTILIGRSGVGWEAQERGDQHVVGVLPIQSGETVGVVWTQRSHTAEARSYLTEMMRNAPRVPTDIPAEHLFVNLIRVGNDASGGPLICDVILGREHLAPLENGSR